MAGRLRKLLCGETGLALAIGGAILCMWLAYVLVLPPWEGFDESAHYSYIAQLADQGEIPDFRTSTLDGSVEEDQERLPRPYAGSPPYENNGGFTYAEFFHPQHEQHALRAAHEYWQPLEEPRQYHPGRITNWQGQHPPLFYALASVPYRLTAQWSPGAQLLALRLFSVALAAGSLLFWYLSINALEDPLSRRLLLGAGAAVLLIPSFCFDLARLGNDSLAALCLAATLYFTIRATQLGRRRDYLLIAAALGCGLLTKAFFVPVSLGIVLFFLARAVWQRDSRLLGGAVQIAAVALLIAGWWFALQGVRYGDPLVTHERLHLATAPGAETSWGTFLWGLLRGTAAFVATTVWCGTWSWVHRPYWQYLLMAPLLLTAVYGLLTLWRQRALLSAETRTLVWLTMAMLLPLLAGFASHLSLRTQATGVGSGTGGYYLFFAWPLVGLCLAGVWNLGARLPARAWLFSVVALAMLFEVSGLWYSLQIYAGVVQKVGGVKLGAGAVPLTPGNLQLVLSRLSYFGFPVWALACYAVSLVLRVIIFQHLIRTPYEMRAEEPDLLRFPTATANVSTPRRLSRAA